MLVQFDVFERRNSKRLRSKVCFTLEPSYMQRKEESDGKELTWYTCALLWHCSCKEEAAKTKTLSKKEAIKTLAPFLHTGGLRSDLTGQFVKFTQQLSLMLQTGGLWSDLTSHVVTSIKIERASNYVHLWTRMFRSDTVLSICARMETARSCWGFLASCATDWRLASSSWTELLGAWLAPTSVNNPMFQLIFFWQGVMQFFRGFAQSIVLCLIRVP